ncbi:uncharacterized protein LOC107458740 [Arachis duranensis]|uniref:Uncharacterized protein LOC107458740 n=1 Tax=Arachis duranensis TaxID=130453 RepID=A0A6P4B5C3_ARADU|nr:uncharacterized protein LOC107458740 [Arachis duranensis]
MKTAQEAQDLIDMVANNQYFYSSERHHNTTPKRGVMELEGVNVIPAQNKQMHQQIQHQMEMMAKRIDGLQLAAPQEKKKEVKPYVPKLPYPQKFNEENKEKQYSKFLEIFKTLHINIPFIEALEQMPLYAKFMKEVLTKKRPLKEGQIVKMTMECSAVFQRGLPVKKDDPGSFHIPCTIGNKTIEKSFCDLGASINLMPLSLMRKLQILELKSTRIALQMANKSIKQALGVVEKVFPSDTKKNPRGETKNVRWEECKAITLRSEETLEEETSRPSEHTQGVPKEKLEEIEQRIDHSERKEPMEKEILKPYMPKAPFPQRLRSGEKEKTYSRFLDKFTSLYVIIPFIESLQQMPSYIKCMKELLTKKSTLKDGQTIVMTKESTALIKKDLPTKKKDPGSFHIPCAIRDTMIEREFYDLGASINLMPLSLMRKLQINELKPINVTL